ncbi:MAG: hypothetical protein AAGF12_29140 [Myxococcota bacterium]
MISKPRSSRQSPPFVEWTGVCLPVVLLLVGCGSEEPTPPVPEPAPAEPAAPPGLESLGEPSSGRAIVLVPEWSGEFEHIEREMNARFAQVDRIGQVLLGETASEGIVLNYYGETMRRGEHRVLPATDETRAEHANKDSQVFLLTVGQRGEGDLRSHEGTVNITQVGEDGVAGTFDVTVRSRNMLRETVVRGRFFATPGRYLEAELEHQRDIREQLRNR